MFKTIADVRAANQDAGNHFFDRDTMRFFKSRIVSNLYGGRYFITSEQGPHGPRKFTIREAHENGDVTTASSFMQYSDIQDAREDAHAMKVADYRKRGGVFL